MKELTKAEEQIMQILWKLKHAFVKEIVEVLPDPKPAYNTVSTIVRILEKKEFVGYKSFGKTHQYFPLVTRERYTRFYLNNLMKGYFDGSFHSLVSFFTSENNLGTKDIDDLMNHFKKLKKNKS